MNKTKVHDLPIGLCNTRNTFQHVTDLILFGLLWCTEHCSHLVQLFRVSREAGLSISKEKCVFGKHLVDFPARQHDLAAGSQPLSSH
jgi:hypothetical protein